MRHMRAVRLSLSCFALAIAFALGGCARSHPSQSALPRASPPVVHYSISSTPTPLSTPTSTSQMKAVPARLLIPTIGINASIEAVGVTPEGDLAVPARNPWENVGWYSSGPHPGERGSAVIDGHLDRPGDSTAVFWRLRDVQVGDNVMVIDGTGTTLRFHVTAIALYPPQNAPIQQIFGNNSDSYLNLITCAGDWIPSQHQTTLRLVVYTSLA